MEPVRRTHRNWARWIIVVLVVIIVIVIIWCPGPPPPVETANDCQQDHALIRLSADTSIRVSDLNLIGPIADLPEYHDCQRFLVRRGSPGAAPNANSAGMAYGPLIAIWARNKLDSAFVNVDPGPAVAVPVALIFNFDQRHAYAPLALQPGLSCLYLWRDSTWHARMRSLGWRQPEPTTCEKSLAPTSKEWGDASDLTIWSDSPADLAADDLPAVARWDWEPDSLVQYIGIRCGNEWCNVLPLGYPAPAVWKDATPDDAAFLAALEPMSGVVSLANPLPSEQALRVLRVSGWNDKQVLDLPNPGGVPTPSSSVGLVIPHPDLGSLTDADSFPQDKWTPVSYLWLTEDYDGKVPLKAGLTRVYLCKGTMEGCGVTAPNPAKPIWVPVSERNWWEMRVPDGGTPTYGFVKRREHGGMAIPVAAGRWNWSEADATTWARCGNACCTGN